jgi:dienelactone hydrolase
MLHRRTRKVPLAVVLLFTFVFIFVCGFALRGWSQQAPPAASVHPKPINVEDWRTLTLANSELHLQPVVVGEKDDMPHYTRELLQVTWRMGDPLDLYIIKPKGVAKPPVVLYLYSYPSETDRFRDDRYCERITGGGVAAIGFVSALTGHRYQNRPMKEWFVSELQESMATSVHDVQMILNFLGTRDDLDLSKVGMFGTGSGGAIAILAASVDARIKAVDVVDPWGDWPDWLAGSTLVPDKERPNYVTPEFLKKVAPLDPMQYLPKLTQAVRIQEVADDADTPKAAKEKIDAAAPKTAQITHYDDTRGFLSNVGGGRLFQWIKAQLQSPAATAAPQQNAEQKNQPELKKVESGHDD